MELVGDLRDGLNRKSDSSLRETRIIKVLTVAMIDTSRSTRKNVKHRGVIKSQSFVPVTHSSLAGAWSLLESDMACWSDVTTLSAVLGETASLAVAERPVCFSLVGAGRGSDIAARVRREGRVVVECQSRLPLVVCMI